MRELIAFSVMALVAGAQTAGTLPSRFSPSGIPGEISDAKIEPAPELAPLPRGFRSPDLDVSMMAREGEEELTLEQKIDGLREAQGDPSQIQQVVAHLLQNAIAAMPEGGELRIGLSEVGGDALKLTVTDSGKGIAPEMRERIFDPFFTTKEGASGVGLGLSISHSIVEAHHGKLLVDSAPGRGATFTILLPAAAPAAHLV